MAAGLGSRPGIGTFFDILLPLAAGATVHAVENISSFPSIPAVALCLFSLVEPSCLSAGPSSFQKTFAISTNKLCFPITFTSEGDPENGLRLDGVFPAACLFIGLWILLAPDAWGRHAFMAGSRPLAALFVLWHLSGYVATSIGSTLVRSLPLCICHLVLAVLTHANAAPSSSMIRLFRMLTCYSCGRPCQHWRAALAFMSLPALLLCSCPWARS